MAGLPEPGRNLTPITWNHRSCGSPWEMWYISVHLPLGKSGPTWGRTYEKQLYCVGKWCCFPDQELWARPQTDLAWPLRAWGALWKHKVLRATGRSKSWKNANNLVFLWIKHKLTWPTGSLCCLTILKVFGVVCWGVVNSLESCSAFLFTFTAGQALLVFLRLNLWAPGQGERHSTALQGLWFPLCGNAALGCTGKYLYCPNVFSIGKKWQFFLLLRL